MYKMRIIRHIIINGDFSPVVKNMTTQALEVVPFENQDDALKKKLAKNNEAKMVLYNALPKKEYEIIFIEEYIDSGFARFNTIITSFKALDESFSSKNYVRKFLRSLHLKWRAKVRAIKESNCLSSLTLNELIRNLKVHKVIMEKDSEVYKGKKERVNSIAFKAKKESCDDETSTSKSEDEEYAMAVRDFKKFFKRKGRLVRQPRNEKKSYEKGMKRKERVTANDLDAEIQIISLASVQSLNRTKTKRRLSRVLGVIAKMKTRKRLTRKLVSWLNRQMR
ncbi:hypothetical protein Tco_0649137 [Tanacetum coccineum]